MNLPPLPFCPRTRDHAAQQYDDPMLVERRHRLMDGGVVVKYRTISRAKAASNNALLAGSTFRWELA